MNSNGTANAKGYETREESFVDYSSGKSFFMIGIKYTYTAVFLKLFDFTCQNHLPIGSEKDDDYDEEANFKDSEDY